MEGALLVGGTLETKPARPLSAPPGGSSLGTYPWDKALHRGVPVSVRRALLPVSPAARVHFSSLNVPHFISQDTCTPIQTYLTLKPRDSLQKAYEKPRVGLVPLRSAQEAPWPC